MADGHFLWFAGLVKLYPSPCFAMVQFSFRPVKNAAFVIVFFTGGNNVPSTIAGKNNFFITKSFVCFNLLMID